MQCCRACACSSVVPGRFAGARHTPAREHAIRHHTRRPVTLTALLWSLCLAHGCHTIPRELRELPVGRPIADDVLIARRTRPRAAPPTARTAATGRAHARGRLIHGETGNA
jgi:hypothetical protein